jgi:hypothetical protein
MRASARALSGRGSGPEAEVAAGVEVEEAAVVEAAEVEAAAVVVAEGEAVAAEVAVR